MTNEVLLDGKSLSLNKVTDVAFFKARVRLDDNAVAELSHAEKCINNKVSKNRVIYGVTTGFGANADKNVKNQELAKKLQKNLILSHAVGVGKALDPEVVRAMMVIRINTLLIGNSGVRPIVLNRLTELLNLDILPMIPEKGSVGASGDLAPLSHMALPLLGEGKVLYKGQVLAPKDAWLAAHLDNHLTISDSISLDLSYKEGLALNNGTTFMTAIATVVLFKLNKLLKIADICSAITVEALCGRTAAFQKNVHELRPHPGQVQTAENLRSLIGNSKLANIPYHCIPNRDKGWEYIPESSQLEFHVRENTIYKPFKGGKPSKPQDSYSLRCTPQVHGAVRDAYLQAVRVIQIELNSVTDNPLIFPSENELDQVISAGNFHGMPIALAMAYLKTALVPLASISERRLNKMLDESTNDGLPGFLIQNLDGTESGFMIIQYTSAALVNDLATRSHSASVYSVPTCANTEDHVSMGANEARHVLEMLEDLGRVLALELLTATQAVEVRKRILEGKYWEKNEWLEQMNMSLAMSEAKEKTAFNVLEKTVAHALEMYTLDYSPSPVCIAIIKILREELEIPFLDKDMVLMHLVEKICDFVLHEPDIIINTVENCNITLN